MYTLYHTVLYYTILYYTTLLAGWLAGTHPCMYIYFCPNRLLPSYCLLAGQSTRLGLVLPALSLARPPSDLHTNQVLPILPFLRECSAYRVLYYTMLRTLGSAPTAPRLAWEYRTIYSTLPFPAPTAEWRVRKRELIPPPPPHSRALGHPPSTVREGTKRGRASEWGTDIALVG